MKTTLLKLWVIIAVLAVGAFSAPGLIPDDPDEDGVPTPDDLCPLENASGFDRNGDGCIDDASGTRHIEYWGAADASISYVINELGAPGVPGDGDLGAIQAAFSSWASIPGTEFGAVYGGTTPQAVANGMDGINLITFADASYGFGLSTLAVGLSTSFETATDVGGRLYRPGEIYDVDMIFNPGFTYGTSGAPGTKDIQSIATHEAGHLFGLSHSAIQSSTMFYVLPGGNAARSLETDDRLVYFKAYANETALATANRLDVEVRNGQTDDPVAGAIVFVVNAATEDTAGCEYTLPDGTATFAGLADGNYFVSIHPLDGTSPIGYIAPGNINALVYEIAIENFVPEWFDAAESNTDDSGARTPVSIAGGATVPVDIVTNIDATAPFVISTSPINGTPDMAIDGAYRIQFSEPIDVGTLSASFSLRDVLSGTAKSGRLAVLRDDSVVVFIPAPPLAFSTQYQLRFNVNLTDAFGNPLATDFTLDVTTEAEPPLSITSLAPSRGVAGTTVVINGQGFEDGATVSFGGVDATVTSITERRIVTSVPTSAITGQVRVVNPDMTESNPLLFTALSAAEVARGYESGQVVLGDVPNAIALTPDGAYAYVATDGGAEAIVVDPGSTDYLVSTPISFGSGFDDVAVTPSGTRAYAISRSARSLVEIVSDPTTGLLFNTILSTQTTLDVPLSIVIDPSGDLAYVTTDASEVHVWDIRLGSPTYRKHIGTITPPGGIGLTGAMAMTPSGNRLMFTTFNGEMWLYDPASAALAGFVDVGLDPRAILVDPLGERAYVTHDDGDVSVVNVQGAAFEVEDIATGGSLRGFAITPGASYLYAADRTLDALKVIDLVAANETFRSVVAEIPALVDPVDVAVSQDGIYAFSLLQDGVGSARMLVSTIGFGPTLRNIYPIAGPPGTIVVLTGADFSEGINVDVNFNGERVEDVGTGLENELVVAVPADATSGPVTVEVGSGAHPRISNPLSFQVLGPSSGSLRFAATLEPTTVTGAGFTDDIAMSPKGTVVMIRDDDNILRAYDIRPNSATYHKALAFLTPDPNLGDIEFTADGKTAFFVARNAGPGGGDGVSAIIADPNDPGFGTNRTFLTTGFSAGVTLLRASPNNVHLFIYDGEVQDLWLYDARDVSLNVPPIPSAMINVVSALRDVAFHPTGRAAYALMGLPSGVQIIDTYPGSPTFGLAVAFFSLATSNFPPSAAICVSPDGTHVYVYTIDDASRSNVAEIHDFTVENPALGTIFSDPVVTTVGAETVGSFVVRRLHQSPRADRAIRSSTDGFILYDIDTPATPILPTVGVDEQLAGNDFAFTPDGARMYVVSPYHDFVRAYDFATTAAIGIASGNNQTGVGGAVLAAPIRVRVTDTLGASGAQGSPGVPVTFEAGSPNGLFEIPCPGGTCLVSTLIVPTDADGYAEARWWLWPGTGVQSVLASAEGVPGSPFSFVATAVPDPESLPLTVAEVIPLDNSDGISVSTAALVTFSREIEPATINAMSLFMQTATDATLVPVAFGFTGDNSKVSLTPLTPLAPSTEYEIVSTTGIEAVFGGGLLSNPGTTTFATRAPQPLALASIFPPSALPGSRVTIAGTGFAAENTVSFGGALATAAGNSIAITALIPLGATPGTVNVTVSNGLGSSNALPFSILAASTTVIDDVVANITMGSSAKSVVISGDGALCYAVSTDGDVVIPVGIESETTYPPIRVGDQPTAIVIHPSGNFAYVSNFGSGSVSVIDTDPASPTFHAVVGTIPAGANPVDVAVSPDGVRLAVANAGSNDVSMVDTDESSVTYNQVVATITSGSPAKSVVISGDGTLYVGTSTGVLVVDAFNNVTATITSGSGAKSVVISGDGTLLFVLTNEDEILVVDLQDGSPSENQVVATIGAGSGAKTVVISADGTLLYIVQEDTDEVLVVAIDIIPGVGVINNPDAASFTVASRVVGTLHTGEDPADVAIDPRGFRRVIVTNAGDGTLTVYGQELPVPVRLKSFDVAIEDGAAVVRWETSFEVGMQGYDIVRSQAENGRFDSVAKEMIRSSGSASGGHYEYRDETVSANRTYWYKLREVADDGLGAEYGPYSVTYRLADQLDQNVPNPFNPTTTIRYAIARDNQVNLTIYDVTGRKVRTLVNERQRADVYRVNWDGINDRGQRVASGVYFYKLAAGKFTQTKKMVLLK